MSLAIYLFGMSNRATDKVFTWIGGHFGSDVNPGQAGNQPGGNSQAGGTFVGGINEMRLKREGDKDPGGTIRKSGNLGDNQDGGGAPAGGKTPAGGGNPGGSGEATGETVRKKSELGSE